MMTNSATSTRPAARVVPQQQLLDDAEADAAGERERQATACGRCTAPVSARSSRLGPEDVAAGEALRRLR